MEENIQAWNSHHWETEGKLDGGQSYGTGFCIAWQRGLIPENGRNGAFLTEVLEACLEELKHKNIHFPCDENVSAITHLTHCLTSLHDRFERLNQEKALCDDKESDLD